MTRLSPVDPDTLGERFEAAGFPQPSVERGDCQMRLVARKAG
jgi:hypothetical protein